MKTPNLKTLRLTDGNLIVGQEDTTCDEYVTLVNPIVIDFGSDSTSSYSIIKGAHYMPLSNESVFTFNRKFIIIESDVMEQFSQYYFGFIADQFGDSSKQTLN